MVYSELLAEYLKPIYQAHPHKTFVFQDDGAPCHRAAYTTHWKEFEGISSLPWVGQSADMNPIEHCWSYMKKKLELLENFPKNKLELKQAATDIWENMPVSYINKLIFSMPRRVHELYKNQGQSTHY